MRTSFMYNAKAGSMRGMKVMASLEKLPKNLNVSGKT